MPYITLGSRKVAGAADSTGLNQGNYTCYFPTQLINCNVPNFEVYSICVTGLNQVANATVYVDAQVRSTAKLLGNAEWDPSQPILLQPGDDLAIAWSFGTGGAPTATIWLRYDPAVQTAEAIYGLV